MGSRTKRWLRRKNTEPKSSDEINYEELREFAQEGSNRYCFDCRQRGPTYVNMTIGSFVCMRCSGLLRGLTPPHRVKSMSMATYTTEEMDFIKARGNEYCKQVWLSLHEGDGPNESADEQEIKDLMIQKYERKRYYVDPKLSGVQLRSSSSEDSLKPTEEEFLKIWRSFPPPGPKKEDFHKALKEYREVGGFANNEEVVKVKADSSTDKFIADFSKAEIFIADDIRVNRNNNVNNANVQPSFANFDNNPIFNVSNNIKPIMQSKLSSQLVSPPPSEDRYAALKDLDNALKTQFQQPDKQVDWNSGQSTVNGSPFNNVLSQGLSNSPFNNSFTDNNINKESVSVHNPFSGNQFNSPWTVPNAEPVQNSSALMFNANPFRTVNGFNGNQQSNNDFGQNIFRPNSQQTTMFPSQPVQNNIYRDISSSANPFKIGSSAGTNTFSNNPFL